MRAAFLLSLLLLVPACSLSAPALDTTITETSRAAPWPELVPLGPLLSNAEALTPRTAEAEGRSLEARAAGLRARAARLQAIRLD